MNTKHTAGPWTFGKPNVDTFYILAGTENIGMLPTKIENAEANAKLIAAAPELLENLKNIIWNFSDFSSLNEKQKTAIKYANELIKKISV